MQTRFQYFRFTQPLDTERAPASLMETSSGDYRLDLSRASYVMTCNELLWTAENYSAFMEIETSLRFIEHFPANSKIPATLWETKKSFAMHDSAVPGERKKGA